MDKYNRYRNEFKYFIYENYRYEIIENDVFIEFQFNLSDKFEFNPKIKIKLKNYFTKQNFSNDQFDNFVFHIGMVELISYWKSTCSPHVFIKKHFLSKEQIQWWKMFYFHGLQEFFYRNSIFNINFDNFMTIETTDEKKKLIFEFSDLNEGAIIPIGGGKDSIVTLELLKDYESIKVPLVINPCQSQFDVIFIAGFERDQIIEVERIFDSTLLKLNETGFLNGHTPYSGLVAFVTLFIGRLIQIRNLVLSNESSSNESTVKSSLINHQYSKSFQFEKDFRFYVDQYISSNLNYFSFLRPLNELEISRIFSKQIKYFKAFKSCNRPSKSRLWCCACSKCLFTFIILSPFIEPTRLEEIFGENLLDKKEFEYEFKQLIGLTNEKPFECVGTIDEVKMAIHLTLKYYENRTNYLIDHFKKSYFNQFHVDFKKKKFTDQHFLNEYFQKILFLHSFEFFHQ